LASDIIIQTKKSSMRAQAMARRLGSCRVAPARARSNDNALSRLEENS
jgi:hypothetical protein